MIILETPRLIIRNWEERDRALFHHINSDPDVMEFFPFRRTRQEADERFDIWQKMITDTGFGFYALEDRQSGNAIGCAGLLRTDIEPHLPKGTVEIGWRLIRECWGKGYVSEAARALLGHGFQQLSLPEIVAFAVHNNERSTAVMRRIGMLQVKGADFNHPNVPESHPQLKRHVLYRITAAQFAEQPQADNPA